MCKNTFMDSRELMALEEFTGPSHRRTGDRWTRGVLYLTNDLEYRRCVAGVGATTVICT